MATYRMQRLDAALLWLCLLGVGVSYYGYVVETTKERDSSYQPMCDISEHVSCTKAFMSKYGKGFGLVPKDSPLYLPNSLYGIIFYTIVAGLSLFNNYWNTALMLIASVASNLVSLYLARVLYLLSDLCVVCISTYVINALLLILTTRKLSEINRLQAAAAQKRKNK